MSYIEDAETSQRERERQQKAKLNADRHRASLEYVMNDARGRFFVQWVLEASGAGRNGFAPDALTNAFNEGKRAVGIALLDRLKKPSHFDQYISLLKEHGSHE